MKYLIAAALAAVCVSAHGKPLREVDAGNDAVIQLHDDKGGICEGSARYAEYIPKDPALKVRGCWTLSGPIVFVVFLDGDTAKVPAMLFKDVKDA
jgi:hypothetical protein